MIRSLTVLLALAVGASSASAQPAQQERAVQNRPTAATGQAENAASAPARGNWRRGGSSRYGAHGQAAAVSAQPITDAVLWLSEQPPLEGGGVSRERLSMRDVMGEGGKAPTRSVWLLQGEQPMQSGAVQAEGEVLLLDADLQTSTAAPASDEQAYRAAFSLQKPGYHQAGFVRETVSQEARLVQIAKTVIVRPAGHGRRDNEVTHVQRSDARLPLEIIREPKADEGLGTRLHFGDTLVYQLLFDGAPLAGAKLTLTTGQGWHKTQRSDAHGIARFTLIRDYFTDDWLNFDRWHREPLLVTAEWTQAGPGEWQGQSYARTRYLSSLSEIYAPSMQDYQSYAWGIVVTLQVALFSGLVIWWYRRRHARPYREEVFHG